MFRDELRRVAAPAVRAESSCFLAFELQSACHLQDAGDGKRVAVVDRRRAYEHSF